MTGRAPEGGDGLSPHGGGGLPGAGGLRLHGLTVGYRARRRARPVLSGLDTSAHRGEVTALLGPNGTGKSTLLRTLAGLLPALDGHATLDGADLAALGPGERARRIATVLTARPDPGLLTARELTALGRYPHTRADGRLTAHDHAVVATALADVNAAALADTPVHQLSDGQCQRVLIARALAQQPTALLLDEPSAFLDATSRVALLGLLRRLGRRQRLVVVLSTHDLELALRLADRIWLLTPDRALRAGTPEELALDGSLSATFDSDQLTFDAAAGAFTLRSRPDRLARVRGGASGAATVARAVSREGWHVLGEGRADIEVDLEVDVLCDGRITVTHARERAEFAGPGEFTGWLRVLGSKDPATVNRNDEGTTHDR